MRRKRMKKIRKGELCTVGEKWRGRKEKSARRHSRRPVNGKDVGNKSRLWLE